MGAEKAEASLDSLIAGFNSRISELQELVIARNMYPASSVTDLSAVDAAVKDMELQVQAIKDRVRDETLAIPKAKVVPSLSLSLGFALHCHYQLLKQQLLRCRVSCRLPIRTRIPTSPSRSLNLQTTPFRASASAPKPITSSPPPGTTRFDAGRYNTVDKILVVSQGNDFT